MRYRLRKCLIVLAGVFQLLAPALIVWRARLPFGYKVFIGVLLGLSVAPLWYSLFLAYQRVAMAQTAAAQSAPAEQQPLRWQFSLWSLLALVTVSAVALGIACLPIPWPARFGPLWAWGVCVVGLALRNYNPKPLKY